MNKSDLPSLNYPQTPQNDEVTTAFRSFLGPFFKACCVGIDTVFRPFSLTLEVVLHLNVGPAVPNPAGEAQPVRSHSWKP